MGIRELIFKAKRIDNGEWVEGYYLKYIKPLSGEIEHRIFISDGDGVTWYAVHGDTICQYTGLTDKNGNKIWENDVVKDKYLKYRVVWDEEEGSWMLESISGARYSVAGIGRINSETFEVIGNIFDGEFQNDSEGTKKD